MDCEDFSCPCDNLEDLAREIGLESASDLHREDFEGFKCSQLMKDKKEMIITTLSE